MREDEDVEGAEIHIGEIYIGETNSEGRISLGALDGDFNVTASLNETEVTERIDVVDSEDEQDVSDGGDRDSEDIEIEGRMTSNMDFKEVGIPEAPENLKATFTG